MIVLSKVQFKYLNKLKFIDNRGIITVELIFASIIILIIIAGIISVISERMDAVTSTDELGKARMTSENVAEAINKVYSGGNGQSITFNLPANISDESYYIRVNSSGVYIFIDGMIGKSFINPRKITYSDKLIESNVYMNRNRSYLIKNVKDSGGNSWIVISEI
ncbi:MAG: hypothetical protein ACXVHU_09655 [Methanobacterium sp.]